MTDDQRHNRIKRIAGTTNLQQSVKTEMLYGIHSVREALIAGKRKIHKIYIAEKRRSKRIQELISLADSKRIPIQKASMPILDSILKATDHQGVGAEASPFPFIEIARFLKTLKTGDDSPFLLVLDHVVDPQNLGGLVRTAACVGINGVIIPKDRAAPPSPAVSKASAGGLEHLAVSRVTNLVRTIKTLQEIGLWIVGLDPSADFPIFSSRINGPAALVVGGEEKGIRPLVEKNCDLLVSIPQVGDIDSLNASSAGAVAMYELYRQRKYA